MIEVYSQFDEKIQQAYQRAVKTYSARETVTGIDIGYKYAGNQLTEEISVRVHVREKIPVSALSAAERLPSELEGVSVDVLQANYESHTRFQKQNPIQPGISISNVPGTAGTLGAIVYDRNNGNRCILSNWHVLASGVSPGSPIIQPGTADGGQDPRDRIGTLQRFLLGRQGDAAIAVLDQNRQVNSVLFGTGVNIQSARNPRLGEILTKSGRTTGITRGRVDGIGSYQITYRNAGQRTIDGFKIVSVKPGNPDNEEISSAGDSGSLWYSANTNEGVGLHFSGETDPNPRAENALACFLTRVLSDLNISLTPV